MKEKIFQELPEVVETKNKTNLWKQLHSAGQAGYVTYEDILEVFPNVEQNLEELEVVLSRLEELGIEFFESEENISKNQYTQEQEEENTHLEKTLIPDTNDLVKLYFHESARIPLLTREDEIRLSKQIEAGRAARRALLENPSNGDHNKLQATTQQGWEARKHLIVSNTRLVISVAKRYIGRGVPFLDLIQEGNIGLMRAIKKFDYRRGFKFSTFATWWIRQAVSRAISYQGRTIRIPVHMGDRINKLYRTQHELKQKLQRDPSIEELAEALNISKTDVNKIMHVSRKTISLDKPTRIDDDNNLGDYIPDRDSATPEEEANHSLLRTQLIDVIDTLPPREAHLLKMRYGLIDGQNRSLHEVGKSMGISRERVRQIESQALRRLRRDSSFLNLRDFLNQTPTY